MRIFCTEHARFLSLSLFSPCCPRLFTRFHLRRTLITHNAAPKLRQRSIPLFSTRHQGWLTPNSISCPFFSMENACPYITLLSGSLLALVCVSVRLPLSHPDPSLTLAVEKSSSAGWGPVAAPLSSTLRPRGASVQTHGSNISSSSCCPRQCIHESDWVVTHVETNAGRWLVHSVQQQAEECVCVCGEEESLPDSGAHQASGNPA